MLHTEESKSLQEVKKDHLIFNAPLDILVSSNPYLQLKRRQEKNIYRTKKLYDLNISKWIIVQTCHKNILPPSHERR